MNNSNTVVFGKVSSSDMMKTYTVNINAPQYFMLKMISDITGSSFDDAIVLVLGFGIQCFEDEFNCTFDFKEIQS
ncbi:hypothetical protein DQY79_24885 [Salmonella enterica subsp. enterica serovar Virchow]|nr:hypothetical protein [Salmonella enterica subsp. enterica serovar Virchow]